MTTTLLVNKDRLAESRLHTVDATPLAAGQIRVRVDSFALTANNITYAAFGDAMHYWDFFPSGEAGWGVVPVWGFGTVVQSLHPGVAVGERLWGYWPMASHAVLQPDRLTERGFADAAPHRAALHALYNQYLRSSVDPFYTADSEGLQSVLRPLFATSWLIDDFMADNDFFGAKQVLLSSASSKTAYGTAFLLKERSGIEVVGFTSNANRAFCESLGCYHRVLAYEELGALDPATPSVYIDFAGNGDFRKRLHASLPQLRYSCAVGGTHIEHLSGGKDLAGPKATLFFAPAQAKKRTTDWGPAEFGRRMVEAWHRFRAQVSQEERPVLRIHSRQGADAVQAGYTDMLAGRVDPAVGHVLSMHAHSGAAA